MTRRERQQQRRAERRSTLSLTMSERDDLVRAYYQDGRSLTWIGETLGVNHQRVSAIIGRLLIERRTPPRHVCPSCGAWAAVLEKQTGWCQLCVRVFRPELQR